MIWKKTGDTWKNTITGMTVGVSETDIFGSSTWEVWGRMPRFPRFDLSEVSGGETFMERTEAISALKKWMRRHPRG